MREPVLVIMAAGMGSRFGGPKQIKAVDDMGHAIIDYSLYDAKRAGFKKVAFIIKRELEEDFKLRVGKRAEAHFDVEYVYQELDRLPEGITRPEGRTKPWGTGQAILCCRGVVKEPFVIINADDYYGKTAFKKLHDFLVNHETTPDVMTMGMAGFILKNTLSENGAVTRGVCVADENEMLTQVIETTGIAKKDGKLVCDRPDVQQWLQPENWVSMNMWACYPDFLECLGKGFEEFLASAEGDPCKKEYLVPIIIDGLLKSGKATVKVLETPDRWIGITYQEDTETAQKGFADMIAAGEYPEKLWG